jgi:benzoylformate decarboxylase
VIVNESTSTMVQQAEWLPTVRTGSFFTTASGGIGWGVPGAVGVALGDRARGVHRTVIATIGDGSFQYSVQAVWTAAQHKLPIVFVVFRNGEYSILKSFANWRPRRSGPRPSRTRHRVGRQGFRAALGTGQHG